MKKFTFVDIERNNNQYTYIYLLFSKKFFKNLFFKFTFESKFPHYNYTDIMKVMRNEGYYFEDLIDSSTNLSIGTVKVMPFSSADETKYSSDHNHWNLNFFENAMSKQENHKNGEGKREGKRDGARERARGTFMKLCFSHENP
ncbi:hypothetical protein KAR91_21655 [Candidatus Pacearchaeota archaeon]|nr:hypothetical protein [Candidatus Pacearchaeota archaeon]